jgi:hypothetical protein
LPPLRQARPRLYKKDFPKGTGVAERIVLRRSSPAWFGTSILRFVIEVTGLCFPAIINRAPLIFPDTRAYYRGGHAIVEKISGLLAFHAGGGGGEALESTVRKARGVRSAFYSLFTYLPTDLVSIWLVVVLQAIIVAAVLRLVFRLACPDRDPLEGTAFTILLALLTTVSWATSNVMPDIFTSVMALGLMLTMVYWNRLTPWMRWSLFAVIAGSVVMHITNLPIALGLVTIGAIVTGIRKPVRYAVVGGALLAGIIAMLTVGVVGFKEWTLAPQSPPFLTARSIQDGPGRLYLLEHCPQAGLEMCHHLDGLDQDNLTFLWDLDKGVYSTASPEAEAKLRAEDKRLYIAAAIEHPWMQAEAIARNALTQLVTFSLHEYFIPSWADHTPDDLTLHMPEQAPWQTILSVPEYIIVVAGLGYIGFAWHRRMLADDQKQLVALAIATVVLAACAGGFSEPVPRYEARVIWLIPMAALLMRYRAHGWKSR